MVFTPPLVRGSSPRHIPIELDGFWFLVLSPPMTMMGAPKGAIKSVRKLNFSPVTISRGVLGVVHGKKVDKTLTVHVELGKTSLNFWSRS